MVHAEMAQMLDDLIEQSTKYPAEQCEDCKHGKVKWIGEVAVAEKSGCLPEFRESINWIRQGLRHKVADDAREESAYSAQEFQEVGTLVGFASTVKRMAPAVFLRVLQVFRTEERTSFLDHEHAPRQWRTKCNADAASSTGCKEVTRFCRVGREVIPWKQTLLDSLTQHSHPVPHQRTDVNDRTFWTNRQTRWNAAEHADELAQHSLPGNETGLLAGDRAFASLRHHTVQKSDQPRDSGRGRGGFDQNHR